MMKVAFLCSLLLASVAFAQKDHHQTGKLMTPPKGKATPPVPINESDRDKRCPQGFNAVGKQCVQTVNAPAEVVCPAGTQQVDGKCAKIVGKHQVCPVGFEEEDEACLRKRHASPQTDCPEGYVLVGKDKCAKKVQGPAHAECPAGSVAKGDQCVHKVTEAPKNVCPNGFKQEGHRCIREDTFDCTPPRKPNVRPTKGGGKKGPATVEEYVIQSTCKRITTEPARKICENGKLEGKVCTSDMEVQPLIVPGKFVEVFVPAVTQCPEGYNPSDSGKECEKIEYATPYFVCPPSTADLGDKCATFHPAKILCPHGFSLENDHQCVKTLFAAPIIEYTVTYKCTGKNCASGKGH